MELGKNIDIAYAGAALAASSAISDASDIIDTADCEGVLFITPITDSVADGVATMAIKQSDSDDADDMAALEDASASATSAAADDLNGKLLIVDVARPQKRYLEALRTSSGANIAFGAVLAIKYGSRIKPVADNSTVAAKVSAVSPDES